MTLYLLTTYGGGDFYVLANNCNDAVDCLTGMLKDANYGFSDDRRVFNVKTVTNTIKPNGFGTEKDKPNLSDKFSRLVIAEDWIKEDKPK